MNNVKLLAVSAAALSLSPAIASAATLEVSYLAEYLAEAAQPQQGASDDEVVYDELGSVSDDDFSISTASDSVSGDFADDTAAYTANGAARASANLSKGELKAYAQTDVATKSVPSEHEDVSVTSTVSGKAEISEIFTITGTGAATFSALVDASWEGDTRFDAFVRALGVESGENYLPSDDGEISIVNEPFSGDLTGSITDRLITLSVDFTDAAEEQLEVFWQIGGFAYAGSYCFTDEDCSTVDNTYASAMLDAAGTANIFFSGSDGLNVSANTGGFLGDSDFQTYSPGDVNAVPLPASGLLMLFGLGGLGLAARRRRAGA